MNRHCEFLQNNGVASEMLDELVHDVVSKTASRINNGGMEEQVKFLLENGYSLQEIVEEAK